MAKTGVTLILIILLLKYAFPQQVTPEQLILVKDYVNAANPAKAKLAKKIIDQQVPFDVVYATLLMGREYSAKVERGFVQNQFTSSTGAEHFNLIFIPYSYHPENRYTVNVYLHGAVTNFDTRQVYKWVNTKDTSWRSVDQIKIFPSGHLLSQWWTYSQVENINQLISFVRQHYNTDENSYYLSGVSDGGGGVYFHANINPTPYSCYLSYIGSLETLSMIKGKQIYLDNYMGLAFLVVNTRKDKIFDLETTKKYVEVLKAESGSMKFFVVDTSGHSTRWYPALKDTIKDFIGTNLRNPFPDEVVFATENPDSTYRKFWVEITKLGRAQTESKLTDHNKFPNGNISIFPRTRKFGQLEVHKTGNRVEVLTSNIKKYRLLISPEAFDFSKPISIYTNNVLSYEGLMQQNVQTLLKYNLKDDDRTMLYGAEVEILVGKKFDGLK